MGSALNVAFAISLNPIHLIENAFGSTVGSFALSFIAPWVLAGTKAALEQVASLINGATAPDVRSAWFSVEYWRVAALASLLTVPFLFAAALQALMRSEPALILKAVFGYLPLALVAITLAAPVVMLLLAATDEMCSIVSAGAAGGGAKFLTQTAVGAGDITELGGSPFLAVVVGLFTLAAALVLAIELLVREAAVYIVVLMLPLAFAALVWPARRIWTVRVVELLVSLILSKFLIVSVLSLAGAALKSGHGVAPLLTAMSLILLSTFAPWSLMRLLPFTELAASAAGSMRQDVGRGLTQGSQHAQTLTQLAAGGGEEDAAVTFPQRLRGYVDGLGGGRGDGDAASTPGADGVSGLEGGGEPGGAGAAVTAGAGAAGAGAVGDTGAPASDHQEAETAVRATAFAAPGAGAANAAAGLDADATSASASAGEPPAGTRPAPSGPMDPEWMAEDFAWPPMRIGPGDLAGPVAYRAQHGGGAESAGAAGAGGDADAPYDAARLAPTSGQSRELFAPEPSLPSSDEAPWTPEEEQ